MRICNRVQKVKAKKEDGQWRINTLDGFKCFYTIDDYDKIMKNDKSKSD